MNLWLGFLFAWCAGNRLRADGPWAQPAVYFVLMFLALIRLPATLYMYSAHPDWSWMYMLDGERVPGILVLSLLFADVVSLLGAYYVGSWLLRTQRRSWLRWIVGVGGGILVLGGILFRERLVTYGSYEQFHSGHALGLLEVKLGYVLVVMVTGFVTAASLVAWELWKDARRTILQ